MCVSVLCKCLCVCARAQVCVCVLCVRPHMRAIDPTAAIHKGAIRQPSVMPGGALINYMTGDKVTTARRGLGALQRSIGHYSETPTQRVIKEPGGLRSSGVCGHLVRAGERKGCWLGLFGVSGFRGRGRGRGGWGGLNGPNGGGEEGTVEGVEGGPAVELRWRLG